jgi:hypothetical protein
MNRHLAKQMFLLALIAALASPAIATDVQFYLAAKGLDLLQTNSAAPVVVTNESPYQFVAEVLAAGTNSVTNVTVKLPSRQLLNVTNVAGAEDAADFVAEQGFSTKKLLDANFKAGSYAFAIHTPDSGSNGASLKLPADAYPPTPQIVNWDGAQAVESELPFVLQWNALTNGGSGSNYLVSLDVTDTNGTTVFNTPEFFQPGALNGTNVSVEIPADGLSPGQIYDAQLLVIKAAVRNTSSVPGAAGIAGYFRQTGFPLATLPEPVSGGRVQLSAGSCSAGETDGDAVVTVTRVGDETQTVGVNLVTSDGTAADGVNYLGVNTALTFAAGMTSTNVSIPILDDFKLTGNLTVNLALSGLTGDVVLGGRSNAVLTIVDSQKAGAGTLQFSPTSYTVSEAAATVKLTVKRTAGTTGAVGVNFHTLDGGALAGRDYAATNGTLVFAAHKSSLIIPIRIINNTLNETNPAFYVALDSTSGGATLGTNIYAKVAIVDNDPGGVVSLASAGYVTNENSGFFYVTVKRTGTGTLASNASVDFATVDGSSVAGVDYMATNGTLTFGTNQSSRTVAIPILTDTNANGYQDFSFQISNPQGGASIGAISNATLTIQYDAPCICISNASDVVSEAATNVAVNLVRFGSLLAPASVDFATVDGTATSPADYRGTNGTAHFSAGTGSVKILIPVVNHTTVQPDRFFDFTITNAQGGVPLGSTTNAVVTILNDEFPGAIQFAAPAFSGTEGSNAVVKIIRTGGLAGGVTAQFTMSGVTAVAGIDYTDETQTVLFNAGQTNVTILVPLILDPQNVKSRTVNLTLGSPTEGATLGTNAAATLTILNNPNPGAVPLNGPLFITGTIAGVPFAAPTNSCTASSNSLLPFQLNATWDTGTVSYPVQNQLIVSIYPRALGQQGFNNYSLTDSASYGTLPYANPNAAQTWSAGGNNSLTPGTSGTFILDVIDYTQKLASGRFTLYLRQTTGGVSGGYISVTGSFRVALVH